MHRANPHHYTPLPTESRHTTPHHTTHEVTLGLEESLQTAVAYRAVIGILGYALSAALVPAIAKYTLRKGLCGKDLGKRFTVGRWV